MGLSIGVAPHTEAGLNYTRQQNSLRPRVYRLGRRSHFDSCRRSFSLVTTVRVGQFVTVTPSTDQSEAATGRLRKAYGNDENPGTNMPLEQIRDATIDRGCTDWLHYRAIVTNAAKQ